MAAEDPARVIVSPRSDVDAKRALVEALTQRGFEARVTRSPADITARKDGDQYYFEIKKTGQATNYFGAATLTEWETALRNPERFFFVTARLSGDAWVFREYSPREFMRFSSIPPFKVFFHLSFREGQTESEPRMSRSIRLTPRRNPRDG